MLSTAIFAIYYLKRSIPNWKLNVLTMLTIAVSSIAYRRAELEGKKEAGKGTDFTMYCMGLGAIMIEVALSGWVSNYIEMHLKDKAANFSVWARNIQISTWSSVIYVPLYFVELSEHPETAAGGFFGGWSMVTWSLALIGALTGFLVAFATKLTDSITKTLAGCMGLLLTYVSEVATLGLSFDTFITANSLIAVLCVVLYNSKLVYEEEKEVTAVDMEQDPASNEKLLKGDGRP